MSVSLSDIYHDVNELSKYRMEGKFGDLTHFEHLAKESLAN